MSSHYVILVTWKPNVQKRMPFALDRAERTITKLERAGHGPLHCYTGNAQAVATQLSRSQAVENVVVLEVCEAIVGVWRRGRKS